ncbi:diacylglycerol kinase [Allorhodopirellula heiligendammensis]|uniref:Undecaprenol kinase n=1 Tax=Allorhodopirellula heiligendammensis TaxID=2714739 RepID=A0A5C6BHK7_9BACT|nr:diacylglycerol kinase [Allorhodopirellula heiligendammensis]TWU11021.1 Undecaprenol kinase [Allorhodopirellula heiligendammensis]
MSQTWSNKFRVAVGGLLWALRDQTSFHVHLAFTAAVITLAVLLRLQLWQWIGLVFAIGLVLAAELFNTAMELLVAVLHPEYDPRIGRALDVAAAAVLVSALTAATIGIAILGPELYCWLMQV